ncbi:glycoside hydrolase family 9 protein [Vibrio fortis]|uniref:glycoside hydrolase family 9 protein n=1 Tax=Vibrio fortis TaxID=212667 RepID=UPI0021C2CA27|nr:glycoside hydrolase family 9 protein [Vibrio fortis]
MLLLTNHIGYEANAPKQAILQTRKARLSSTLVLLVCADDHVTVDSFEVTKHGRVANWHQGNYFTVDFSAVTQPGRYYLRFENLRSEIFEIGENLLMQKTFSDVLHYFKSQRCGGIFDKKDKQAQLLGTDRYVDVHGGWYDASGDVSKYFSHLSYGNYLNPQQIPMVVWNMLKGLRLAQDHEAFQKFTQTRLIEEALFGADFLVRMQDAAGYFYTTVFDKWSKDINQRDICSYATQEGIKSDDFQAGFRQGAGVAIAALASASALDVSGEYSNQTYLETAEKGYWHLKEYNHFYLNDGEENIIDEYCALLATSELYRVTKDSKYLAEARVWANRLAQRQQSDQAFEHFWSANADGSRPYFHAAEAGLPVIALCEYLAVESDAQLHQQARLIVEQACRFEIAVTDKVVNPFGYPRQYVKPVDGEKRDAFFVAHNNETGYWWQGENARLGSLATMALLAQPYVLDEALKARLITLSQNCLDWILGLNPYHMCMLDGHGHNNPDYLPQLGFFNAKGGICNGITAGFDDEEDIAFNPPAQKDDMLQNWRWGEQWIPHGAWYLLATAAQFNHTANQEGQ